MSHFRDSFDVGTHTAASLPFLERRPSSLSAGSYRAASGSGPITGEGRSQPTTDIGSAKNKPSNASHRTAERACADREVLQSTAGILTTFEPELICYCSMRPRWVFRTRVCHAGRAFGISAQKRTQICERTQRVREADHRG